MPISVMTMKVPPTNSAEAMIASIPGHQTGSATPTAIRS